MVCIDFGGGLMSILIFMKKYMIYVDVVCMGGDYVISDILMGF